MELFAQEPLAGQVLAVDQTGVAHPVLDSLRKAKPHARMVPILITSGNKVNRNDRGGFNVPKKDLVGALQLLLQSGRLQIAADLPLADVLVKELTNFHVKITVHANAVYEAWREGLNDDCVLATACAAWAGEKPRANYSGLIQAVRGPSDDDDR